MGRRHAVAAAVALFAGLPVTACDGSSPGGGPSVVGPEGGVLTFDAAVLGADGGPADGGASVDSHTAVPDAGSDEATDTRLFVPDFPNTYDGPMADPGFAVIAHTVRTHPILGTLEYLVAIRNTFGLTICTLDLTTTFYDSTGAQIGRARGLVETPPHRSVSGTGRLASNCLGPGQIGMQSGRLDLGGRSAETIARATWVTAGVNLTDAVPTGDLVVTGVIAEPDTFGGSRFRGRLENRSSGSTFRFPEVSIFGLNAVGRPLFESGTIGDSTLRPGGTWDFQTSDGFTETYATHAAFPGGLE